MFAPVQVMFYAANTPVEQLCTFQYSLVTLIPGACILPSKCPVGSSAFLRGTDLDPGCHARTALLTNLEDSASPALDERSQRRKKPSSLKTSDKYSLIRYLGLPLDVFGKVSQFLGGSLILWPKGVTWTM